MQGDNNEIRNTSFSNEEIYKSLEFEDYKENLSYDTKVKKKSIRIVKLLYRII